MKARVRLFLTLTLFTPSAAFGQPQRAPVPIVVGEARIVQSKALNEARTVNVYLPPGYKTSGKRYPVLYLIDGGVEQDFLHVAGTSQLGGIWGRSEDIIVVGIETKDRRKELTGPTRDPELLKKYPTAGGSAAFRAFIRNEVKPLISSNYRVSGKDAVIGESLAGLFIVETYLREPKLFGGYAAISPSLWWDKERLSFEAKRNVTPAQSQHRLYLTIANEGGEQQAATDRLLSALPSASSVCHAPRPDLTHAIIYHAVSPTAFQFLFPTKVAQDPQYGFEVACSPRS